jgi:hypothetical protein
LVKEVMEGGESGAKFEAVHESVLEGREKPRDVFFVVTEVVAGDEGDVQGVVSERAEPFGGLPKNETFKLRGGALIGGHGFCDSYGFWVRVGYHGAGEVSL